MILAYEHRARIPGRSDCDAHARIMASRLPAAGRGNSDLFRWARQPAHQPVERIRNALRLKVDRRTLARWRQWWLGRFVQSPVWKEAPVKLSALRRCRSRQWGACWLACPEETLEQMRQA